MVSNRIIHHVIVICLLTATVMLGSCSPPVPKTWHQPVGGMKDNIPGSIDRGHGMTISLPPTLVED
jgi:hypothetical protein